MNQSQFFLKQGYDIDEVCVMTGLCRQSIYNEINNGNLKTFKIGRRRLVSPDAIQAWIKGREAATA